MIKYVDGFDHYNSQTYAAMKGWVQAIGASAPNFNWGTAGRVNGKCLQVASGNGSNAWSQTSLFVATYPEVFTGVALSHSSFSLLPQVIYELVTTTGAVILQVQLNANGTISLLDSSSSVIATGTFVATQGQFFFLEIHAHVNGASGTVNTQVNGVADIASTVHNIGSTNVGGLRFLGPGIGASQFCTTAMDDVYLCDPSGSHNNTFLGDVHIETLYATADGHITNWTPDSGTAHFSRVNEQNADGDTSYVFDSTLNDIDSYHFGALSLLTGTVFAVVTNMLARKDTAAVRALMANLYSGGVDHQPGASQNLSTSYTILRDYFEVDPNTGTSWTIAGVNGTEYGAKVST